MPVPFGSVVVNIAVDLEGGITKRNGTLPLYARKPVARGFDRSSGVSERGYWRRSNRWRGCEEKEAQAQCGEERDGREGNHDDGISFGEMGQEKPWLLVY